MFNGFEQNLCRKNFCIRTKIFRTVLNQIPGHKNPREILVFNANPWKRLVVLHHHIIKRLMFLDQVIFKEKCVVLAVYHSCFQPVYFPDHDFGSVAGKIFVEVRKDPFLQIFCFSHIQKLPVFIIITVNSRI
ncbi:hypothetical protein SDC9_207710 [bioreactor metagenome]|uniref:Uncharacterized protein n=1 Tax=bioreactor metagenome TaxID=1076179 RepID=A0A645J9B4_9ZZZZ